MVTHKTEDDGAVTIRESEGLDPIEHQRLMIAYTVTMIVSTVILVLFGATQALYSFVLYGVFPKALKPLPDQAPTCRYNRMHGFVLVFAVMGTIQLLWITANAVLSIVGFRFTEVRKSSNKQKETPSNICSSNGMSIIRAFLQIMMTFILIFMATENWSKSLKCSIEQHPAYASMTTWLIVNFVFNSVHWIVYLGETLVMKTLAWSKGA